MPSFERIKDVPPKTVRKRMLAMRFPLPEDLHLEGDYTESECAVLEVIASENLEHGVCQHSRAVLAEMSGTSPGTVRKTLAVASEHGILAVEPSEKNAPGRVYITSGAWMAWYVERRKELELMEKEWAKIERRFEKRRRASNLRP